ncbi:MAG: killer suppression protein HigA [Acidobacteriia bacterium]|nr:killer suppression protein HigA [Terriglobia bacterium]
MQIRFKTRRFEKAANSESLGNRDWGLRRATKIRQRLAELAAANTLADMSTLPPPRCHQLREDLDEQFAVDISRNQRLVFEVDHNPIPRKPDEGIDLAQVTAIVILRIEDYHGH